MPDENENENETENETEGAAEETEAVTEDVAAAKGPEAEVGAVDESAAEESEPTAELAAASGDVAAADAEASAPGAKPKKKRLPRSERPRRTKHKREKVAERKPITRLPKPEHARGRRQERQGTVVSASADKTIVVRVDVVKAHPTYKKVIKRSTRLHAHDERNEAKPGDIVRIVETRPLSKMKCWRLQEIVEAAK